MGTFTAKGRFGSDDILCFIESHAFTREWNDLGLDLDCLVDLQDEILTNPERGSVIGGTAGLRKMRFAPEKWHIGKRGALRICYVYFETHRVVWLGVVYAKNTKDNLSASDKKSINQAIDRVHKALDERKPS